MGVDLTLCPYEWLPHHYLAPEWLDHAVAMACENVEAKTPCSESATHLAYTRIRLERDRSLMAEIQRLPSYPLPPNVRFMWYGDEGVSEIDKDAYGLPLRWVYARDLATVGQKRKLSPWNAAVLAMIRELPGETPVVLYWH